MPIIRATGEASIFRVTALCKRAKQVINTCLMLAIYGLKLMGLFNMNALCVLFIENYPIAIYKSHR